MIKNKWIMEWILNVYFNPNMVKLIKIRKDDTHCRNCEKLIHQRDYCYSNGYSKICIDCAEEVFNSSINKAKLDLRKSRLSIKAVLNNLKKNKEKYQKNNVVNAI